MTAYAGWNRAGLITTQSGVVEYQNVVIKFEAFSLFNIRNHPSIIEVYYVVESKVSKEYLIELKHWV